ncbi:nucleotide-diphospho-sugar transferase [Elsinoe ampelina]|uniref:Nucleotide-diphospho-sugar transferase n=1 Tax=Elsinoe ampelina TaxID=302913 RepID=A0A6A6G7Q1_9PEZI|nr:nucleotide-diphospho-sugar transferase [Elsinoe ampelina]
MREDRLPLHRQQEASTTLRRSLPLLHIRPSRLLVLLISLLSLYLLLFHNGNAADQQPGKAPINAAQHDRLIAPGTAIHHEPAVQPKVINGVDYSRFAYIQYATSTHYLCNAVLMFEALHRYNSSASRLLLYSDEWDPRITPYMHKSVFSWLFWSPPPVPAGLVGDSYERRMLLHARDQYNVILKPVSVLRRSGEWTWAASFTKLLAFNQTQFARVISLDSDATLLQHVDELFLRPPAGVVAPKAYWLEDQQVLSSQVMLIEPSQNKWDRIMTRIDKRKDEEFDMEIVNAVFGKEAAILEHRGYDLLSGEFRKQNHAAYLAGSSSSKEPWDAEKILKEAKYIHFSDWPLKKPWFYQGEAKDKFREYQPNCTELAEGGRDCDNRDVWLSLYENFLDRRMKICDKLR